MQHFDGIYLQIGRVLKESENKRRLTLGTVILVIAGLIFSLIINLFPYKNVQALDVANGDGILFYAAAANTTPQWRTYTHSTNDFSANSGTVAGAQPAINQIKTSPTKQEAIAGYQDTSGNLRVLCYDGTSWSQDWTVAVAGAGTPTTRRFDIVYETNTGDVTVAYSRNTAAVNALAYRTKAGSTGCGSANWAAAANFPTTATATSATVMWVRAARDSRSAQNLSAWVWLDNAATNADLGGAIWSGSTFTNFKSLETSMEHITSAGDTDNFDVQYESLSGDVMVVWGNSAGGSGVNGYRYNTCTGGTSSCTWLGSAATMPTTADGAMMVDLSADPLSDKMAMAGICTASDDMSAGYWDGTGPWRGYANVDTSTETTAQLPGMKLITTGWLTNNGNTKWYLSYDDSTGTGISYKYAINGGAITSPSDYTSTPALNDLRGRYDTDMNPFNSAELIQTISDNTNGIFAYKLSMDTSGNLSWSNMTTAVSLGSKPSHPQQGFSFTYWRYIPPVITVGTAGSQAADMVIPSSNNSVGGAFTFIRDSGSANITSIKISEKGTVNANTNLSNLKLYYETSGICSRSSPTQFGTGGATFNASDEATVTGTMAVSTSQVCLYVDVDIGSGASDNQTLEIEITNPSTDLVASAGVISPATTVAISGTTTLKGNLTVGTTGTQTANMNVPSSAQYVGGAFTFIRSAGSTNVTQIIVSETGSVNANLNLANLDLYYETVVSCSYEGTETLFGTAATFDSSENATVTGTMAVGTAQICLYAVLDVGSGAAPGQKIDIEITNPSTEVQVSAGTVLPITPVAINLDTNLQLANQAPNLPTNLGPAGYIDAAGWMNDNTPTFNFDITDPDVSEQVKYRIQIDDTAGFGSVVLDYQPSSYGAEGTYNYTVGQAGSYTVGSESMTLSDSAVDGGYYWRVKAIDDDLAESAYEEAGVDNTIDFRVDATAPTGGSVYDGTAGDQDWNDGTLNSLSANWTGFDANASGLLKYEYALRRTADGWYWNTTGPTWQSGEVWYNNGASVAATVTPIYLNTGVNYYFSVKCYDNAGNIESAVSSNGQQISPTLSFSLSGTTITFADLNNTNGWTDTKTSTVTTSTNAYSGYTAKAYITQLLTSLAYPARTIPNFSYNGASWASPQLWPAGQYGFGYTSNDTLVQGSNRFSGGTKFAPFSQTASGDVVADHTDAVTGQTGAVTNEQFTITYKVAVSQIQAASAYQTYAIYIVTANY